jgi:mono/diheme cytochrome c family protein
MLPTMLRNMLRKTSATFLCAVSLAAASSTREPLNGKGRQLVLDACTACHTLDRVRSQRLTREEWRQTIAGMLSEGVPLTDDELTLVVDYLARNFGPEKP